MYSWISVLVDAIAEDLKKLGKKFERLDGDKVLKSLTKVLSFILQTIAESICYSWSNKAKEILH